MGLRPALASAVTAWLPESSCRTRRSICSRSASSPSFAMTWSCQTFSKKVFIELGPRLRGGDPLCVPLFQLLELLGVEDHLAVGEHHELRLDPHDRALLAQVAQHL